MDMVIRPGAPELARESLARQMVHLGHARAALARIQEQASLVRRALDEPGAPDIEALEQIIHDAHKALMHARLHHARVRQARQDATIIAS